MSLRRQKFCSWISIEIKIISLKDNAFSFLYKILITSKIEIMRKLSQPLSVLEVTLGATKLEVKKGIQVGNGINSLSLR